MSGFSAASSRGRQGGCSRRGQRRGPGRSRCCVSLRNPTLALRLQRLQQRASDEVAVLVDLALHLRHVGAAFAFRCAHVQELGRVVPFVQGLALLQAVVALQADQAAFQHLGKRLGQRRLSHAGLALQQQRALQLERQEHGRGQPPVGKIAHALQGRHQGVDGGQRRRGHGHGRGNVHYYSFYS